MSTNNYLEILLKEQDENLALNDLLNRLNNLNKDFIYFVIDNPMREHNLSDNEITFVTKCVTLIHYFLVVNNLKVPSWIKRNKWRLKLPVVLGTRGVDDFYLEILYTSPAEFRYHNVYFHLNALERI